MSMRIIILDESIMDQVNMGNAEIARRLVQLFHTPGVEIHTPLENYSSRSDADKRALDKNGIELPGTTTDDLRRKWRISLDKANLVSNGSRSVAALALEMKLKMGGTSARIEIMSVDAAASTGYKTIATLTQETSNIRTVTVDKRQFNFARAHQLLGLKLPDNINPASGQAQQAPRPRPTVMINGKPAPTINGKPVLTVDGKPSVQVQHPGANGAVDIAAKKGNPITINEKGKPFLPPATNSVGTKAAGKAAAINLGIRGAHALISWLIDDQQKQLFNADWAKKKAYVTGELAAKPSLGALVFAHYSQRQKVGQERDNSEQFSRYFQYVSYEFGRTESEAMRKFHSRKEMNRAGEGANVPDKVAWIPPAMPVDPSKLPTPFPAEALATFVTGRDLVMDVKWKGRAGFDDAGETRLGTANRLEPLFLVLSAPEYITFMNGAIQHTVHIELSGEHPAETEVISLMPLTTVELDASWRPFADTSAAMVYPADEYTTAMFGKAPPIKGTAGQLHYQGLEHVRFVEPENIRVLRDFRLERKGK